MELNSIDKYTVDRYFDILDNILYNYKGEFENA